ncbi:UPF0739 protein C1orf74 homolog [Aplochiton taeniatus]
MAFQDIFIAAARKTLCVGKKSLSMCQCVEVASLVLAVNLGLKPALLYDINAANANQIQQYLKLLQSAQQISESLLVIAIDGNSLIINTAVTMNHLEKLIIGNSVAVIDVSHSLQQPCIANLHTGGLRTMIEALITFLQKYIKLSKADGPLHMEPMFEKWNLCTLFGILLGYPATYWFDQNKSFENCLAMTPLTVTKASVNWLAGEAHKCCLQSFSIPELLQAETQLAMEDWNLQLQERFQQQTMFSELTISRSTVTLPAVTL